MYSDLKFGVQVRPEHREFMDAIADAIHARYPGSQSEIYVSSNRPESFRSEIEVRTVETRNERRRLSIHLRNLRNIVRDIIPS